MNMTTTDEAIARLEYLISVYALSKENNEAFGMAIEAFDCNNKVRYRAYLPFKMPTLEKNEIVDIDEALKANGMSR